MRKIDLPQELKQKFLELGTHMLREEYFRRLKITLEAARHQREVPELIEFLDKIYPDPPADFEKRLEAYANGK